MVTLDTQAPALLDPGETVGVQLALENWCWTTITARAWLDYQATYYANQDIDPRWYVYLTNGMLVLPSATGDFGAIAHRATGWQTNAFALTLATNVIGRGMWLYFIADVPETGTNFAVQTYLTVNNPEAVYAPAALELVVPHGAVTNVTLAVTNTGTRELVAVYTSAYAYLSVTPLTNVVAPGSNATFTLTLDAAQATATDAIINAVLYFDANGYARYGYDWRGQTNAWFDEDVSAIPLRLVISANTLPVWHMQVYYSVPETTDVYIALPRYTNHWYLTNKYVITLAHEDAQTPETNLVTWYMSWPAGQVLVTQENLFARMWPGNHGYAIHGTIWTGAYHLWVRDDGVPQLASTTTFYVLRTQVNLPPYPSLMYPNVFEAGVPISNAYFRAREDDVGDTLTITALAIPPGAYLLPQTSYFVGSYYTRQEWRWDNPVEGVYSTAFVVTDDGEPPLSASLGKDITVLPECGAAGLLLAALHVMQRYRRGMRPLSRHPRIQPGERA